MKLGKGNGQRKLRKNKEDQKLKFPWLGRCFAGPWETALRRGYAAGARKRKDGRPEKMLLGRDMRKGAASPCHQVHIPGAPNTLRK